MTCNKTQHATALMIARLPGRKHESRSSAMTVRTVLVPMFHVVLVAPQIPPNTGNVIRLCANTGCDLHLIEPIAFSMDDKQMRRAGLDYHEYASVRRHASWDAFLETEQPLVNRLFALSTRGRQPAHEQRFEPGDWLVFGNETSGLSNEELQCCQQAVTIPSNPAYSSLNLGAAVQVMAYELRMAAYGGLPPGPATQATPFVSVPAAIDDIERFYVHLERVLAQTGFHDPARPRRLMPKLRRLFARAGLEKDEINILRGILDSIEKPTGPKHRSSAVEPEEK